jgi:hypothetical protein
MCYESSKVTQPVKDVFSVAPPRNLLSGFGKNP